MFGWLCGIGLLSSSPQCSAHLLSCMSTPVRTVPFLSLIGRSDFLNFPANFFVVSYRWFTFLLAAARSASSASPSTKSGLSIYLLFSSLLYLLLCALSGPLLLLPLCGCYWLSPSCLEGTYMLCSVSSERHMQYVVNEPAQVLNRRSNHWATTSYKKYIFSIADSHIFTPI